MALKNTISSREYEKFEENADDGGTDVRVVLKSPVEVEVSGGGNILSGIEYDEVQATYPTGTTEVYTYKLSTVTVAVVTVTYTDATKSNITSLVRT